MNTSENSDSVCIRGKQSVLFGNLIVSRNASNIQPGSQKVGTLCDT